MTRVILKNILISSFLGIALLKINPANAQYYGQAGGWIIERSWEYKSCIAKQVQWDVIIRYGYDGITGAPFINFSSPKWLGFVINSNHTLVFDFYSSRYGRHEVLSVFRMRDGMPTFEVGSLNDRFLEILGGASKLSIFNNGFHLTNRPISLRGTRRAIRLVEGCRG